MPRQNTGLSDLSAGVGGPLFLNVEGNLEAQLLGRDMDESTPLLQHDNAFIRVPLRLLYRLMQALIWFFLEITETAARIVMFLLLVVGVSLGYVAATSREFNPILVVAAACIFILVAIIHRLNP